MKSEILEFITVNHPQFEVATDTLKDKATCQYSLHQMDKVLDILTKTPDGHAAELDASYREIGIFLAENWQLIKGSMLSYTAMPHHPMTTLCLKLARWQLIQEKKEITPQGIIEKLMPTVSFDATISSYPLALPIHASCDSASAAEALTAEQILSSHIEGREQHYLIPAWQAIYLTDPITYDAAWRMPNTQYDYTSHTTEESFLTPAEMTRLEQHSNQTLAIFQNHRQLKILISEGKDLYSQLVLLANELKINSIEGLGAEEVAGHQGEIAIRRFFDYFSCISESQFLTLPDELRAKLNPELVLLRQSIGQYAEGEAPIELIDTCLATRKSKLLKAIEGYTEELSAVTTGGDESAELVKTSQQALYDRATQLESEFWSSDYSGADQLPITLTLIKDLEIPLEFSSLQELILLTKELNAEEMAELCSDVIFSKSASEKIQTLDDLLLLKMDLTDGAFFMFLEKHSLCIGKRLFQTPNKINALFEMLDENTSHKFIHHLRQHFLVNFHNFAIYFKKHIEQLSLLQTKLELATDTVGASIEINDQLDSIRSKEALANIVKYRKNEFVNLDQLSKYMQIFSKHDAHGIFEDIYTHSPDFFIFSDENTSEAAALLSILSQVEEITNTIKIQQLIRDNQNAIISYLKANSTFPQSSSEIKVFLACLPLIAPEDQMSLIEVRKSVLTDNHKMIFNIASKLKNRADEVLAIFYKATTTPGIESSWLNYLMAISDKSIQTQYITKFSKEINASITSFSELESASSKLSKIGYLSLLRENLSRFIEQATSLEQVFKLIVKAKAASRHQSIWCKPVYDWLEHHPDEVKFSAVSLRDNVSIIKDCLPKSITETFNNKFISIIKPHIVSLLPTQPSLTIPWLEIIAACNDAADFPLSESYSEVEPLLFNTELNLDNILWLQNNITEIQASSLANHPSFESILTTALEERSSFTDYSSTQLIWLFKNSTAASNQKVLFEIILMTQNIEQVSLLIEKNHEYFSKLSDISLLAYIPEQFKSQFIQQAETIWVNSCNSIKEYIYILSQLPHTYHLTFHKKFIDVYNSDGFTDTLTNADMPIILYDFWQNLPTEIKDFLFDLITEPLIFSIPGDQFINFLLNQLSNEQISSSEELLLNYFDLHKTKIQLSTDTLLSLGDFLTKDNLTKLQPILLKAFKNHLDFTGNLDAKETLQSTKTLISASGDSFSLEPFIFQAIQSENSNWQDLKNKILSSEAKNEISNMLKSMRSNLFRIVKGNSAPWDFFEPPTSPTLILLDEHLAMIKKSGSLNMKLLSDLLISIDTLVKNSADTKSAKEKLAAKHLFENFIPHFKKTFALLDANFSELTFEELNQKVKNWADTEYDLDESSAPTIAI
jgi:hypothetical protein